MNAATATELAALCPFVARTYAVAYTDLLGRWGDAEAAVRELAREWDYVVDDGRSQQPDQLEAFAGLRAYYAAAARHLRARVARGVAGAAPPPYRPHQRLRLELPEDARERARRIVGDAPLAIAVMPAGSSERSGYPSAASWRLILSALGDAFPGAAFALVGKHAADGRTATTFAREELDALLAGCPGAVDCFDVPLVDQLAVVATCRLFVSPHTGFGTAAVAVGTPWLTLAGGRWHEYLWNGVPSYSVLPDADRYPCYTWLDPLPVLADDEGDGPRTPSMSAARIRDDLPELVDAARMLVDGRLSYEDAVRQHFRRLLEVYGGDRSRIFSFDGVHERYV